MSGLTYGSLFAGYDGLGMGLRSVLGGETSWFAEYDAAPSKILAHHHPDVPNLGDVTKVDWATVPKVDILDGGSPCQDLSHAGKRAGMKAGTRSGLWASMCDAIEIIRPGLVVWENVRGALSAEADGGAPNGHELCLCGGTDRRGRVHPSGRDGRGVLAEGDSRDDCAGAGSVDRATAGVGRDALPDASRDGSLGSGLDVAPHGMEGSGSTDCDSPLPEAQGWAGRRGARGRSDSGSTAEASERAGELEPRGESGLRGDQAEDARHERQGSSCSCPECGGCVDEGNCALEQCPGCVGGPDDGPVLRALGRVLGDLAELGYDARWYGLRAADVGAPHGRFRIFVFATDATSDQGWISNGDNGLARLASDIGHERAWGSRGRRDGSADSGQPIGDAPLSVGAPEQADDGALPGQVVDWGQYAPAIHRWEQVLGRAAPAPTTTGPKGGQRLSAHFVEFLMGLPEGHVTGVKISRNDQLKALGNGVVPQQAAEATRRFLLDAIEAAA